MSHNRFFVDFAIEALRDHGTATADVSPDLERFATPDDIVFATSTSAVRDADTSVVSLGARGVVSSLVEEDCFLLRSRPSDPDAGPDPLTFHHAPDPRQASAEGSQVPRHPISGTGPSPLTAAGFERNGTPPSAPVAFDPPGPGRGKMP